MIRPHPNFTPLKLLWNSLLPITHYKTSNDIVSSIFNNLWPYGPAQEQPDLAWIPNKSLNNFTKKLQCNSLSSCLTVKDTILTLLR